MKDKTAARKRTFDELRGRGIAVGDAAQMQQEQLHEWEEAGLERILLQWLDLDDLAGLESLAKAVL